MRVKQPVLPNHARPGIAKYDELAGSLLVPNQVRMFLIVHADRDQARSCLFEFTRDRSPAATIENQQDARSAQA
jgi:hypothetical protein